MKRRRRVTAPYPPTFACATRPTIDRALTSSGEAGQSLRVEEVELGHRESALEQQEAELQASVFGIDARLRALDRALGRLTEFGVEGAWAWQHALAEVLSAEAIEACGDAGDARRHAVQARLEAVRAREAALERMDAGLQRATVRLDEIERAVRALSEVVESAPPPDQPARVVHLRSPDRVQTTPMPVLDLRRVESARGGGTSDALPAPGRALAAR